MRDKLMGVMREHEASRQRDGDVEMDDVVLGGEKREIDGENAAGSAENSWKASNVTSAANALSVAPVAGVSPAGKMASVRSSFNASPRANAH